MALTQSQEVVDYKFREFKRLHFPKATDGMGLLSPRRLLRQCAIKTYRDRIMVKDARSLGC